MNQGLRFAKLPTWNPQWHRLRKGSLEKGILGFTTAVVFGLTESQVGSYQPPGF